MTDVAIIGAGIVGISVAYYLVVRHGLTRVVLVDAGDPMALTSAQSGENYRNWWPHPAMTGFTDQAIDLLEEIARASGNRIHMTRRGYALATRRDAPDDLIAELHRGYGDRAASRIRVHGKGSAARYQPAMSADWEAAPDGVDVLTDRSLIQAHFPSLAPDVATILHIRRAGDISGQQLGQFMLETIRSAGGSLRRAKVVGIEGNAPFTLRLEEADGTSSSLPADRLVNAAGPFFAEIAAMLGEDLPVSCVFQQKIAFEDREGAIPRNLPFTIDLDGQELAWTEEERAVLSSDPETAALLRPMPGGIHRRPEGGDGERWIKLGWAYNQTASDPCGAAADRPELPGHRTPRGQSPEPGIADLSRAVSARRPALRRLLRDDAGELALDRPHAHAGRLHGRRALGLWHDGRHPPRAPSAPPGSPTQRSPATQSPSPWAATTTQP